MSDRDARRSDLTSMWEKTANAILRALDAEEPSAAMIEASRKFLIDNQTTLNAIREWQRHPLGFDPSALPKFDDTDAADRGAHASADPLRVVPPFVATDSDT